MARAEQRGKHAGVKRCIVLGLSSVLAWGCTETGSKPRVRPRSLSLEWLPTSPLDVKARPGAASPRLTASSNDVVLSWLEPEGEGWRLQAQTAAYGVSPETVVQRDGLLQNFADMPSVFASDSGWLAAWPQRRGEDGYDLQWARRGEDGQWNEQGAVSDATTGPEFGFVSWAADAAGAAYVFWLDGRASTTSHGGAMQLWTATVGDEGLQGRRMVDDRVCDCCQTAAASTPRGPVVVYRDRDEGEIRDIWMAGPGPEQKRRVGVDDWRIQGCPVNGPAVATHGERVAVAWFTATKGTGRVQVAFADGEQPFSAPVTVDDGAPMGRVDLVWLDDETVAVTWMETTVRDAQLRMRRVSRERMLGPQRVVLGTDASRRAGFPQLERRGDLFVLAWVRLDTEQGTVDAVTAPVSELPSIR